MSEPRDAFAVSEFPDIDANRRFEELVGLDSMKDRLLKEAGVLLKPSLLADWDKAHHGGSASGLVRLLLARPRLFIFSGDVGTGKTALAETIGDAIARNEKMTVMMYRMSLTTRGTGAVGEMTRLITDAFDEVTKHARAAAKKGKASSGYVLVIDEADALAQSRESAQMHHEDRAGVNALIRGIDQLSGEDLPAIVVMCTNRFPALDPAVRRRAAAVFDFTRPNESQRYEIFKRFLEPLGFQESELLQLAQVTGFEGKEFFGYTYSDIFQRLLPSVVMDAFPNKPISFARVLDLIREIRPTAPFQSAS
jgi:SpoVK/Ycf46/Vps4 family AAA+-type ATPase